MIWAPRLCLKPRGDYATIATMFNGCFTGLLSKALFFVFGAGLMLTYYEGWIRTVTNVCQTDTEVSNHISSVSFSNNNGTVQQFTGPKTVMLSSSDNAPLAGLTPQLQSLITSNPSKSIICHTVDGYGRLGNHLFEYASILGIAATTNKSFHFFNLDLLKGALKYLPVQKPDDLVAARCKSAKKLKEAHICQYDRKMISLETGKDYNVFKNFQSWMYFDAIREEMKTLVTFKDSIVAEASDIIRDLRRQFANATLVGIHVRRGDITIVGGHINAPIEFYNNAMNYFRKRFPRVAFVVLGEPSTISWSTDKIKANNDDVIVLKPRSAAVDMQVLSTTDHMIRTIGTFNWWCAFKMTGRSTVIFFQNFIDRTARGSKLYSFSLADYMMPGWIPM